VLITERNAAATLLSGAAGLHAKAGIAPGRRDYETPTQYHNAMEPHAVVAAWDGEAPGSIALESAIDEMAEACGLDPLAFRLKNYAEVEPISDNPFSSKALRECYAQGAERFGWSQPPLAAWQMHDEAGLLVGWGIGTARLPALMFQAEARAVVRSDGSGLIETGAHEMGQGASTALAQIAADGLGLALEQVEFRTGTSDLPDAGTAGGSTHTATAGMAIHNAPRSSPSSRIWPQATSARRCSVPAMPESSRGAAGYSGATMKGGARGTPPSSAAPG
jgi:CO/xanthine dehydrogenase Mo-binding subunit